MVRKQSGGTEPAGLARRGLDSGTPTGLCVGGPRAGDTLKFACSTLYRRPQLAALLRVSVGAVDRMVREGRLPPKSGTGYFAGWTGAQLNRWMREGGLRLAEVDGSLRIMEGEP